MLLIQRSTTRTGTREGLPAKIELPNFRLTVHPAVAAARTRKRRASFILVRLPKHTLRAAQGCKMKLSTAKVSSAVRHFADTSTRFFVA